MQVQDIELSIEIAAPPEVVFKYFSDPRLYRTWMGETSYIEPHPGGTLSVAFGAGPPALGEILEWKLNERIVFNWGHGDPATRGTEGTSHVTISLKPTADGTLVTLRHSGLPNEMARQGTAGGWRYYLSQLSSVTWTTKMDGKLEALIDAYVRAWGEDDYSRRAATLAECFAERGELQDKFTTLHGRDSLNAHISTVKPMMPGMQLRRNGAAQQCHSHVRFPWRIEAADGSSFATGTNFCELDAAGLLKSVVGFWD